MKQKGNLGEKKEKRALWNCKSSFHAPLRKSQILKCLEPVNVAELSRGGGLGGGREGCPSRVGMGKTPNRKSCRSFYCRFPFGKMALFLPTMTREGCTLDGLTASFKAPAGCRSRWRLSRSELFISKIVPVPKFPFPRKGFWHRVLIKKTQCKGISLLAALCV